MPDWRNPAVYHQFPPDFPGYRWAWEFLRRNPDYRSDWDAALARFRAKPEFEEVVYSWKDVFFNSGKRTKFLAEDWTADPEHPGFYLPVGEAERWRLQRGLFNPSTDRPKYLGFRRTRDDAAPDFGSVHFLRQGMSFEARGPAYPIVAFDLREPLKPQFDAIYSILKNQQERAPKTFGFKPRRIKHHRELWPRYLRLLDADLDERTPTQIADVLQYEDDGANERKIWDQLQAARKLIQPEGYLSIFLSTEKSAT
jgi:hypothetical protein